MYDVTLINLAADARSVTEGLAQVERRGLGDQKMRELLQSFSEIDPVQNAAAEPELRVQVRTERYLLRMSQRQILLYDMLNRDLPGHAFTVAEAMAELDGSAEAERLKTVHTRAAFLLEAAENTAPPVAAPVRTRASRPRVIALVSLASVFAAALIWLHLPWADEAAPPPSLPLAPSEVDAATAAIAGVYLTGTEPGQHGIALTTAGELRLFELRAIEPPRVLLVAYRLGRVGEALCLETDQPGGRIVQRSGDALAYCGEVYRKVP